MPWDIMGGGGAASGGMATAPGTTPPSSLPQMPYQPEAPAATGMVGELREAGAGLLDPSSAYSRRMRNEISEDIGARTAAQQRGAALRAAQSGLGAGASPELLDIQSEIGREGLRATGDATAGAMLGGVELGGRLMSPALQGQLGIGSQQLQGYLAQQNIGAQQERDQLQANLQAQQLANDLALREFALLGSGFGF